MKKRMLIFLLAFCGSALAASVSVPSSNSFWKTQSDLSATETLNGGLNLTTRIHHEENSLYKITISYPTIKMAHAQETAGHFDERIKSFVTKQVSDFKQSVASSAENKALPQTQSYLNINYDLGNLATENSQKIAWLSVRFNVENYVRGMAHPYQHSVSINYDLAQGKVLELQDLFKPNTDFLSVIANYCIQQLQKQKTPNLDLIKSGAAAKLENYKTWNLTRQGLLITFDPAQVAPSYFGTQQILVPKEIFADLLNPSFHAVLQGMK
jgi:hypothetical protein